MRSLIPILLLLAPSLFALTSANKPNGPRHDAEIYKYRGHALAEIWVGRGAINAGDVHGQDLYYQMNTKLRDFCKIERSVGEMHSCDWNGLWERIPTHEVKMPLPFPWPTNFGDANLEFWVEAEWTSKEVWEMMIEITARAMQELTSTDQNCYSAPNRAGNKMCNTPDFIRINMPALNGQNNYMHVHFRGGFVYGSFQCCATRDRVDLAADRVAKGASRLWGINWSREVRCLVTGLVTCEECGSRCDKCYRSPCM